MAGRSPLTPTDTAVLWPKDLTLPCPTDLMLLCPRDLTLSCARDLLGCGTAGGVLQGWRPAVPPSVLSMLALEPMLRRCRSCAEMEGGFEGLSHSTAGSCSQIDSIAYPSLAPTSSAPPSFPPSSLPLSFTLSFPRAPPSSLSHPSSLSPPSLILSLPPSLEPHPLHSQAQNPNLQSCALQSSRC